MRLWSNRGRLRRSGRLRFLTPLLRELGFFHYRRLRRGSRTFRLRRRRRDRLRWRIGVQIEIWLDGFWRLIEARFMNPFLVCRKLVSQTTRPPQASPVPAALAA